MATDPCVASAWSSSRAGQEVAVVLTHAERAHGREELRQLRFVLDDLLRAGGLVEQPGHVTARAETGKARVQRVVRLAAFMAAV